MKKYSLNKTERLKSKKEISRLFKDGKFLYTTNFKLGWDTCVSIEKSSLKTAVSIPKKNFKLAVDRNRLKRQIKEIYRLNKNIVYNTLENSNLSVNIIIIFNAKNKLPYKIMEPELITLLEKLSKKLKNII